MPRKRADLRLSLRGGAAALVATVLLLAGCAGPTLSHYQLTQLNRGMASSEVTARLAQPPLAHTRVTRDGRSFNVERYRLYDGMSGNDYYLAYEQGRLVYWGFISEYRRHPDPMLGQVIDLAAPLLAAPAR